VVSWAGYLVAASGIASWLAGSNPLTMFVTSTREASAFAFLSHNILTHWALSILPFQAATLLLALGGAAIALVLLLMTRQQSRLLRWTVCACVAMFWAYRKHYDVPLMIFPLTAALVSVTVAPAFKRWAVFLALGTTLWLPLRDAQWDLPAVQVADLVVWLTSLGLLLSSVREGEPRPWRRSPQGQS